MEYSCSRCSCPLFHQDHEYYAHESAEDRLSFYTIEGDRVCIREELFPFFESVNSWGITRAKVSCAQCKSVLGYVYPDGPLVERVNGVSWEVTRGRF
ncbi:hypothetical protein CYMTET_56388 [Cymbomonas tetramitiformis]|uniref:Protein yippee-like n=1 Tax=Cymbomonas tetramitiformis TaxID=36881 RepID=A0AAE0BB20_9CHLO|nr:hypothetical protein CYMTET_56388 [Cymbomonas tetramitiformis]